MGISNQDQLIGVKEAARQCRRNPETIRRWIWSGKLPAEKLGNQYFIEKSALESYCRETIVKVYQFQQNRDFIERAVALQNKIMARGGEPTDGAELIRKMREERTDELS